MYAEKARKNFPSIFTIWKDYFTLGYYLGVVPFKPRLQDDPSTVKLHRSKLQKVICFLLVWCSAWLLTLADLVVLLAASFRNRGTPLTAKTYFILLQKGLGLSIQLLYFLNVVKYQEKIENYLNQVLLLSTTILPPQNQYRGRWWNIYVICVYLTYFSIATFSLPFNGTLYSFTAPQESFHGYVAKARVYFFLNGIAISEPYSPMDISLGVVQIIWQFLYHQLSWFKTTLFVGPLPVTFWLVEKNFQEYCASQKGSSGILKDLAGIQDKYEAFKRCVLDINAVWGTVPLIWAIDAAIGVMMSLNFAFRSMHPANVVIMVIWILFAGTAFILSGETYRTMASFRGLLLEQKNWDKFYVQDRKTLLRILKDIDGQIVGIGLTGFYRLTYGFLVQLLVAVITMFLVSFEN